MQLGNFRPIATSSRIFEYETRYNRQDQAKILELINAAEAEDLTKFEISKGRVSNIMRYRTRKGPFREVEELLEVDGFGVKVRVSQFRVIFLFVEFNLGWSEYFFLFKIFKW